MNNKNGLLIRILLFLLWFGLLFFIVDGLVFFPIIAEKLGYVLTETLLWVLVLVPAFLVAKYAWGYFHRNKNNKEGKPVGK